MIAAGTSLLHYRIVEKIGEGGMGAVVTEPEGRASSPITVVLEWAVGLEP